MISKTFKITKNKFFELEAQQFEEHAYFSFRFLWTRKCDHAGLELSLEIWSLYFSLLIYDCRHWDYDKDKWTKYEQ